MPLVEGLEELAAEEDRVPAQRHDPDRRLELEAGLEPLEVLQHVGDPPPGTGVGLPPPTNPGQPPGRERQGVRVGGEVHQLHAALHDPCPGGAEPVVDQLEQVGVEQVLGVGHADPGEGDLELVQHLHGGVETDRLVVDVGLLRIRAHQDLAGVLARLVVGDRRRARVVGVVDDRHHPVVGVVQPRQPLQRLARDRLLVPHRDQDHPGSRGASGSP